MSEVSSVLRYGVEDGVASIVLDSPPVNALSHRVRTAIRDGLAQALADDGAKAIVLACAGRTFFAGADVTEIGRPIEPPLLADIMAMFEASTKPVIAALHGTALGGGFELALACHFRVATPSAKVGLPEVALGLLPGAGGTQRTPRLIGVAAAVEMIGLGKPVGAADAVRSGLIDAVVEEGKPREGGIAFARRVIEKNLPLRRVRDLPIDVDAEDARVIFARFRAAHPDLFIGLKAADGVLRAIEAAVTLPFDEGLDRERAISRDLVASPQSAAQRHLFFAERAAAKIPGAERIKAWPDLAVAFKGEPADVARWRSLAEASRVALDDASALVVHVSNLADGDNIAFRRTGAVVEIAYGPEASLQSLIDAMEVLRRLSLPGVFVKRSEGLVIERLRTVIGAGDLFRETCEHSAATKTLLEAVAKEAAAIVAEGVVYRASDIDFAMVRSGVWPVWLGGPAFWNDRQLAEERA